MRELRVLFQESGLIEAIVSDPDMWAYAYFILGDQMPVLQSESPSEPRSLTRQVLRYAAVAA